MASLKKYDLNGSEVETVELEDSLVKLELNSQMVKDYLVAMRANKRQWSAKTKDRSEVKCTTRKPHPQKGTGNARQGSYASPQYRGGGVVFGPRPKFDQHIRINRKERRAAIRGMLAQKIQDGKLSLLKIDSMNEPKTRVLYSFLKSREINKSRVLFLGDGLGESGDQSTLFVKSMRNIPKTSFKRMVNVNGYDLALSSEVIVLETAIGELRRALGEESKAV